MKILYIANSRLPTEKAHGFQIIKMIEAFQNAGAEIQLYLPHRHNPIQKTITEFYGLTFTPKVFYAENYFGFFENSFQNLYFALQRFFFAWQAFFFALRSDTDFIFTREITLSYFLSVLGKKVIFEDHEPKKRFRWLYLFFVKGIWKKVIVPENLVEMYKKFGVRPNSYIVAPNGVDLKEFDSVSPNRDVWKKIGFTGVEKIILYVGHFYQWKGVYTLLDAASLVPNEKIVLIGGTEADRNNVLKYAKEKKLHNVLVHPFVSHKEIIKFIKSADVLVLPNTAKEERSAKFTTPIKLFEYMAAKVPIVASSIPSFSSFLNHGNAYLVMADQPKELGNMIVTVLKSDNAREKAFRAYEDVKIYTWENRAKNILNFFSK